MSDPALPENLVSLHKQEEQLRSKAIELIAADPRLQLHMITTERAMDVANTFRKLPTDDEDLKVPQILGMRLFNAFGASTKLALSGYHQNAAQILRDVLETVFLLDLFGGDHSAISRWRLADRKTIRNEFSPVKVRDKLDKRYGHTTRKREELYRLFSELAGHPTMKSAFMLQPKKNGDAVIGPFMAKPSLDAVVSRWAEWPSRLATL
jgi:hypothetical protein